ncbi:MAG: hypothetical protein ABJN96_09295 [Marinomonas sp.]
MTKWFFTIIGGILLLAIALFAFLAFTFWKYEHGFPKSILHESQIGFCVTSKQDFVLIKRSEIFFGRDFFEFLPKPDGRTFVYSDYIPRSLLKDDGTDLVDTTGATKVASNTQFIVKDIFQNRTLNDGSEYFYWLERGDLQLESNFFFEIDDSLKDEIGIMPADEMSKFPENSLFHRGCADN